MGEPRQERAPGSLRESAGEFDITEGSIGSFIRFEHEHAEGPKVILAPGLGETAERSFKEPARALASRGHDVFAITHPTLGIEKKKLLIEKERIKKDWLTSHGGKLPKKEADSLFEKMPISELRKALTLITFIEQKVAEGKQGESADVIAHSQGGAYALIAAFLRPDLFRRLILVNPAGQSGRESFVRMYLALHANLIGLYMRGERKAMNDALYSFTRAWLFGYVKAIRQGFRLSRFDAYPYLKALGVIAPDLVRTTLYDTEDMVFRRKKIEDAARVARGGQTEESAFGKREKTKGKGHYGPVTHPEEYAEMFHKLLTT